MSRRLCPGCDRQLPAGWAGTQAVTLADLGWFLTGAMTTGATWALTSMLRWRAAYKRLNRRA